MDREGKNTVTLDDCTTSLDESITPLHQTWSIIQLKYDEGLLKAAQPRRNS